MRTLVLALALLAGAVAAPAYAQDKAPLTAVATPPVQANPTPASVAAARDVLQFMFVDSGALDLAITRAFETELPGLHAQFRGPGFAHLSASKHAAVDSFIDSLPSIAHEEFERVMPQLLDETAAESATLFTETEIVDISTFMRTSAARDVLVENILRGVEQSTPGVTPREAPTTPEQDAALAAFEATPSGQAFGRNIEAWLGVMSRHFDAIETTLGPAMQQRTMQGLCDALGSDCPPALRQQLRT